MDQLLSEWVVDFWCTFECPKTGGRFQATRGRARSAGAEDQVSRDGWSSAGPLLKLSDSCNCKNTTAGRCHLQRLGDGLPPQAPPRSQRCTILRRVHCSCLSKALWWAMPYISSTGTHAGAVDFVLWHPLQAVDVTSPCSPCVPLLPNPFLTL